MDNMTTVKIAIVNTYNFSALETLRGMILGYFTSPLIETYGFGELVPAIKELCHTEDFPRERAKIRGELLDDISDMMKAVNAARRDGVGETCVGSYNIGGVKIPKIETRELTCGEVDPYLAKR